jgi:hypothetical protein
MLAMTLHARLGTLRTLTDIIVSCEGSRLLAERFMLAEMTTDSNICRGPFAHL